MAKVTISKGEVTKHLGGKGFILEVNFLGRTGEGRTEKWTVWGEQPPIGTVLEVEGDLTIKMEEFNGDNGPIRYARGHINNPVYRTLPTSGNAGRGEPQVTQSYDQVPF
jgi:hypothetical protein